MAAHHALEKPSVGETVQPAFLAVPGGRGED